MKNVKFFLSLALFLSLLLSFVGCGGLRPASIDAKDDIEIEHQEVGLKSHKLALKEAELKYKIEEQSYDDELGGYQKEDNAKWKTGVIANNFVVHRVRFLISRGAKDNDPYDFVVSPGEHLIIKLPMGKYTVMLYDQSPKGQALMNTFSLNVTNKAKKYYKGNYYHFVLLNDI